MSCSVRPAKTGESDCWPPLSVLTQRTPFRLKSSFDWLPRFMQTSSVGGVSVTLHTAEAVKPRRPPGPSLVITFTAAPSRAIASRNASLFTIG